MNKLLHILSSFFSKGVYDLDGYHFKNEYKKNKDNVLLDVRTGAEHNNGSLPSALHLDYSSFSYRHRFFIRNKNTYLNISFKIP